MSAFALASSRSTRSQPRPLSAQLGWERSASCSSAILLPAARASRSQTCRPATATSSTQVVTQHPLARAPRCPGRACEATRCSQSAVGCSYGLRTGRAAAPSAGVPLLRAPPPSPPPCAKVRQLASRFSQLGAIEHTLYDRCGRYGLVSFSCRSGTSSLASSRILVDYALTGRMHVQADLPRAAAILMTHVASLPLYERHLARLRPGSPRPPRAADHADALSLVRHDARLEPRRPGPSSTATAPCLVQQGVEVRLSRLNPIGALESGFHGRA